MGEIARGNDLAKQAWGVVDCKKEVIYMLDTLIRGAKIVDGTGKAAFTADVGILDGMIEEVGDLSNAQAFETIEAAGRVLTPGFIDMHRHADAALFREGFGEAELCQGLTTLVNGNCGMSLAPLSGAHADECAKYLAPITGNIPPELRFASIDSYFKAAQGRELIYMLDTLIRGAKIVDGTGKAAFTADVGILDGMIEEVGDLSNAQAFETIEAAGRVLTPGFIDMHRHADAALFREGFGEAELCQGLTTLVNGNCGMSLAPLSGAHADECAKYLAPITGNIPPELRFASIDSYFKAAQGRELPLSCAELIGMGTLRTLAAGFTTGDLSPLELRDLHYHMEAALADGACGVSLGLGYAPEIFYSTDGLIRALAPLHRSGVPICVHMRQEGDGVVDALREMLEVARALQTPLEISHLKAIGGRNARKAVPEMLLLIERARQDGLDVMCDVYPYTAGSTQLIHVLPPEFQEGGTEALTKRLLDDAARKEMRARMEAGSDFENITLLVGFDNVVAIGLRTDEYRRFEGKSVAEIAQTLQKDPFDTLFDLLAAEQCNTGMIDYISDEEDVKDILRTPFSGVISDATYPSGGRVHPRVYGTFARLIEKYVVQERVLTLEQAVHKVTGHAADRFGFEKKGVIAAGMDADLLLFSPENVREHGTYARPNLPATGFDEVFVLGERVIENGVYRGGSSGEMLGARMGY